MSGHLFVVHGDLCKISVDARLIPSDASGEVLPHWRPFGPHRDRAALRAQLIAGRVSDPAVINRQHVRYVNTGLDRAARPNAWLTNGVRAGLRALANDLAGTPVPGVRSRHLIGMPLFGVGAGGFDQVRGRALTGQLSVAREVAAEFEVDIVIVCFERSDFAALQRQRTKDGWDIPPEQRRHGESLAASAVAGRLVLFFGAGVSAAAGAPTFAELVEALERSAGRALAPGVRPKSLPARVQALHDADHDDPWINKEVSRLLRQTRYYSLTHGLLASLRVFEAITTNFDRLYELACTRPFADHPLEVLPWQRSDRRNPWLLKAHGDPWRGGTLVLTAETFKRFEAERAPTAGVLRSMFALNREVLFVGYSLSDKNIKRLVDEAARSHETFGVANPRLGTIISIDSSERNLKANPVQLGIRPESDSSIREAGRRLQILLDYVLWQASSGEASWVLDERYEALHASPVAKRTARRLAATAVPDTGEWKGIEDQLRRFGKRDR